MTSTFIHNNHGWWLDSIAIRSVDLPILELPANALTATIDVDVAIVGGGFTGLWTAWHLISDSPGISVAVIEAERCGYGPSGRNGGFVHDLWMSAPELVSKYGRKPAEEIYLQSGYSIDAIGAWAKEQNIDIEFQLGGYLRIATSDAQLWNARERIQKCLELFPADSVSVLSAEEAQQRSGVSLARLGCLMETGATVNPAKLVLGLRRVLLQRGVQIYENSPVIKIDASETNNSFGRVGQTSQLKASSGANDRDIGGRSGVIISTQKGKVQARQCVLAAGHSNAKLPPLHRTITVGSSHIVVTEPIPEIIDSIGWVGGEAVSDWHTLVRYFRTTKDGRILFGWGGGRVGSRGRIRSTHIVDRAAIEKVIGELHRYFPETKDAKVIHGWGGPIDISANHLPLVGSFDTGNVHYGLGYTGQGVCLSHFAGRILSSLALQQNDELTRLALVNGPVTRLPSDLISGWGAAMVRQACLVNEDREDQERPMNPIADAVTSLPHLFGVELGR